MRRTASKLAFYLMHSKNLTSQWSKWLQRSSDCQSPSQIQPPGPSFFSLILLSPLIVSSVVHSLILFRLTPMEMPMPMLMPMPMPIVWFCPIGMVRREMQCYCCLTALMDCADVVCPLANDAAANIFDGIKLWIFYITPRVKSVLNEPSVLMSLITVG